MCHPERGECVSICNPPCAADERCTDDAACVPDEHAAAAPAVETGDRRIRLGVLGRFGIAGKLTLDFDMGGFIFEEEISGKPEKATMGFELRVEKPLSKHFVLGGLLSNYFIRPGSDGFEYALDISPFVKPRLVFRIGQREAEVYLLVPFGASILALRSLRNDGFSVQGKSRLIHGGFNVGASPGFQVFLGDVVALVVEVGYAYSWFRIKEQDALRRLTLGQLTFRTGLAFAF